jgi:hypothetical protein
MTAFKVGDIVATTRLSCAGEVMQGVVLTSDGRGCVLAVPSDVNPTQVTPVYRYYGELEPVVW